MNISFLGHYNNTADFGLLRKDNDPYTTNKYGLVNNASKREIALHTGFGAIAGIGGGRIYNDIRAMKETNKRLSIKDLDKRIKGSWKAKAVGAGVGAGLIGGTHLLLRKTRKDKGKKRK